MYPEVRYVDKYAKLSLLCNRIAILQRYDLDVFSLSGE